VVLKGNHSTEESSSLPLSAGLVGGGFIVLWSFLYLVLIVTLGLMSIRKGHWVMFIIGVFLPIFWLIGALMPSRRGL
jgi:hypothetical protein